MVRIVKISCGMTLSGTFSSSFGFADRETGAVDERTYCTPVMRTKKQRETNKDQMKFSGLTVLNAPSHHLSEVFMTRLKFF